jgi:hypothetical protein
MVFGDVNFSAEMNEALTYRPFHTTYVLRWDHDFSEVLAQPLQQILLIRHDPDSAKYPA